MVRTSIFQACSRTLVRAVSPQHTPDPATADQEAISMASAVCADPPLAQHCVYSTSTFAAMSPPADDHGHADGSRG